MEELLTGRHHHHHHPQSAEISPLPINSYGCEGEGNGGGGGNGHAAQHLQIPPGVAAPALQLQEDQSVVPYRKKEVRYRECLKNHAAAIGGSATDGCGEFMPGGEEGTLEALSCAVCNCHRNFHRKETEGLDGQFGGGYSPHLGLKNLVLGHPPHHHHHHHSKSAAAEYGLGFPTPPGAALNANPRAAAAAASASAHHKMMMLPYGFSVSESDQEQQELDTEGAMMLPHPHPYALPHPHPHPHAHSHLYHHQHEAHLIRKRFRTKFTQEQKEKMLSFAEKTGWKLQRQEDEAVQQFCQEIGVKRRVLKVWMHNNKHNLCKKDNPSTSTI